MTPKDMERYCRLETSARHLLRIAVAELDMSARGCSRILKVARAIADVAGADQLKELHLSEALEYRSFSLRIWRG